ncbi:MAG: aspartyl/asparaginyl beta-hydroxylase domain-containing protein [Rhizomicrobium sp.]
MLLHLNLALARRSIGDAAGELAALDGALAADPLCFPARLAKGALLERQGQRRAAARIYKDALVITPPEERLSPSLAQMAQAARRCVEENSGNLDAFLRQRLGGAALPKRFEECLNVATGKARIFTQQPANLHYPQLPAIAYYDNADFPWLKDVEAATDVIHRELVELLREDAGDFAPYVNHPEGVPLNQWAELNNSPKWSAYFLWKDSKRQDAHCDRCPRTAEVLAAAPMARIAQRAPTAFFSSLEPRAHIPAHTGATNARLIVHLPLIVPDGCRFRVGNDTRDWQRGKAWVFDDTIEHEAWNDSDKPRVVLIFDIWNPFLSAAERELLSALEDGLADYYLQP